MFCLIYEAGMLGASYSLRIGNIEEIRNQLAYINDWMCLVNTGRTMAPKKDKPKLKELLNFLTTCDNRKTLETFKISISTGELGCVMCAETENELEEMRKVILSAPGINVKYHQKLNGLFDKLIASFKSGDDSEDLYRKVAARQYIDFGISRDDYLDL
jgi:hypothetical protein